MNKFRNIKKLKPRKKRLTVADLSEEQRKAFYDRLSETMEKQRKTVMNLHYPRPGRRI